MKVDEFLEKLGLKFEDLNEAERETYFSWLRVSDQGNLSIEKIREFVISLRENITQEVSKHDLGNKQDTFLKARLRNIILLEAMLSTPERARKALEQALATKVK